MNPTCLPPPPKKNRPRSQAFKQTFFPPPPPWCYPGELYTKETRSTEFAFLFQIIAHSDKLAPRYVTRLQINTIPLPTLYAGSSFPQFQLHTETKTSKREKNGQEKLLYSTLTPLSTSLLYSYSTIPWSILTVLYYSLLLLHYSLIYSTFTLLFTDLLYYWVVNTVIHKVVKYSRSESACRM